MKFKISLSVFCCLSFGFAFSQPTNVTFTFQHTAPDYILRQMEQNAKAVFDEINNASRTNREPKFSAANISTDAISNVSDLWATSVFHCLKPVYVESVNKINRTGIYSVKNILVYLKDAPENSKSKDLMLEFDSQGKIYTVKLSMEQHQYKDIMEGYNNVTDFNNRQMIANFLENFRTAYNRKDSDYLTQIFSDDALIITGNKTFRKTGDGQMKPVVSLREMNKTKYIDKLKNAFNKNKYIDVKFENLKVMHSEVNENFYGVRLWQKWNSSTYSDEGNLFLIISFKNPDKPEIWVRAWQDGNFNEDELYGLDNYRIKKQ